MEKDCIFCKIVKGEIPSFRIWENEEYLAILDAFPNTRGQTLVMPKEHYDSYVFDMSSEVYTSFMRVAKEVSKILEKGLNVHRVALVMEGLGVNHAHLKLYPLHGVDKEFKETWAKEKVYFEKYEGFISTQLGPVPNKEELAKLVDRIKNNNN